MRNLIHTPSGRRDRLGGLARLALLVLLVPLLTGTLVAPVSAGDPLQDALAKQKALQAKIDVQKKQIARLRELQGELSADMAVTTKALAAVNADLVVAKKHVAKTTTLVNEAGANYLDLAAQVTTWDATVAQLDEEVAQQERLLSVRKALLATRIRAAYETGRVSLLETLLSAQSFTDVVSDVSSYVDFAAQDRALADQIDRDRQLLEVSRRMSVGARETARELRVEARAQKLALNDRLAELRAARDEIKKLEDATAHQLAIQRTAFLKRNYTAAQLKQAMAREVSAQNALKRKIRDLIAAQQLGGNIPSQYNGSLIWPMGGVVTQEYGCTGFDWEPSAGNCAHFHNGIDIAAPMGTPIRAAGDGIVVFAGPNPYDPYPKAWIVIIAHSTTFQTWYAHLETNILVRAGQQVGAGQVVGYVGMTGRTSGPHLHWGIVLNDSFVNPRLFL
ncbi:MAG: peptidoglycan DD-metalloendopeptidase family protein [Chloroflexota bacterium]